MSDLSTTAAAPQSADTTQGANRRVLIVDDDRVTLILLSHIARQDGWDTVEVGDLAAAREALTDARGAQEPFRAVLSDYELPDGSGLDLLEDVLDGDPQFTPRFVLVTGHQERSEFRDDRIDRVDHFLVKPVSSHALAEALGATAPVE